MIPLFFHIYKFEILENLMTIEIQLKIELPKPSRNIFLQWVDLQWASEQFPKCIYWFWYENLSQQFHGFAPKKLLSNSQNHSDL